MAKKGDTKMTPELVDKLDKCFALSFTDQQACDFVGIDKKTLYKYCKKNKGYSTKKERLKGNINLKAKMNVVTSIQNGSIKESKWWLERKVKDEFSVRVENTGEGGGAIDLEYSVVGATPETIKAAAKAKADRIKLNE